jgi:transposase-like protein
MIIFAGMKIPEHQLGFERMFTTEEQCIQYIMELKWPEGYECPRCKNKFYWLGKKKRIICSKCEFQTTVISGTIFEQTNKPLMLWFRAIWWMVAQKNGVSAVGLQKILGLGSYQTAWTWLQKLRLLTVVPDRQKLSGEVEVDETFIGGEKAGKRGRGSENKSVVAVAVEVLEKGTGRIRLQIIPSASAEDLTLFITTHIERGSTVITDGWNGYNEIAKKGYTHHIEKLYEKENLDQMLSNAHKVASLLKRWLIGTHQNYVSQNRLQNYLEEFVFRYNRRKSGSRGLLFQRIMEQAVKHNPVKYKEIMNNSITGQK